jgi:hypothetical protein
MIELERRLGEWASEYAGARHENIGWSDQSPIHTLMIYHGRKPQGLNPRSIIGTAADAVEDAVRQLETMREGWKPGRVVRCEYWMRSAALEHKLDRLRAIGLGMTERAYYHHLKVAKVYVAGALGLPFSAMLDARATG